MELTENEIPEMLQSFYLSFGRWMRYQYKSLKGKDVLTLPQFQVLFIIGNLEICNMSSLSEVMEVSKGTMTCMLNKLVEEDYVERKSCVKDRRNVYVSLTEKGNKKVKEIRTRLLETITIELEGLEEDARQQVHQGLEILSNIFKGKK
ncbi:MarR family winged helix-turn-helix transcriptional regulator [Natronincola ferrireducens]|uniref:DNA-binding transcriptional regulator, MarR family n=1 Tax=Natronincola ferrireducens TaxID=393762 RepID=A0A1G9FC16_9FIRM|nr:MarR family transcriptional regulator [Natronincola ferrireducens]SDK85763.1 DNA-binding transcriptional regulator, MarR family [Natronincola ferrireducens]